MISRKVGFLIVALLATGSLAVLAGCDWFKGSETGQRSSPVISKLLISKASVLCDQEFVVSFQYADPQGDILNARVRFQRSGDTTAREETPTWPATSSRTSGNVSFPFNFTCASKGGLWTITVFTEDEQGNASNELTGVITLNAAG